MSVITQNKGGLLVNEEFSVPEMDFYKKHTQKTIGHLLPQKQYKELSNERWPVLFVLQKRCKESNVKTICAPCSTSHVEPPQQATTSKQGEPININTTMPFLMISIAAQ